MKVKATAFVPLGRKVRLGEWFKDGDRFHKWMAATESQWTEAYERREVEVEVETVPDWISVACAECRGNVGSPYTEPFHKHPEIMARHFRSLVDERAKAAAERLEDRMVGSMIPTERVIREVFLK